MSDVISFRLNENNPREEKARRVLDAWAGKGYSLRHILTEALLRLDDPRVNSMEEATLEEVKEKLDQISRILEHNGNGYLPEIEKQERKPAEAELTVGFLGMIRQAVRPGLMSDEIILNNRLENNL